jgi:hypothetical protein
MKFLATVLALTLLLAGPALATPGDPRLIQGTLEWPPTLTGGEPFVVRRGDDEHTYYVDVTAARRQGPGVLSAGSRMTLVGLEGTKSHEIVAVAFGSGDATALSLALAVATLTAPLTGPPDSTTTPGTVAAAGASRAVPSSSATGSTEADTRRGGSTPAKPARPATVNQWSSGRPEVVYPHGKYVLYGDGVSQPYRWVWIRFAPPVSSPTPPQ